MATSEQKENLTLPQQKAITSLLTHRDVASAAKDCGVAERTLYRWVHENKEFQAALRKAENQMLSGITRRLTFLGNAALDVLALIMADKEKPASSRVAAARAILDNLLKIKELVDMEKRIAALEEASSVNK